MELARHEKDDRRIQREAQDLRQNAWHDRAAHDENSCRNVGRGRTIIGSL
jgi:hypothetical protein